MSNSYFQFKQFRIEQERCAMKVTTDACILGAWTPLQPQVRWVLDIGTGTGLLSLMLAQRSAAAIDGMEYEADAAAQAWENVLSSPWQERINICQGDVRSFSFGHKYDLIISNPPFFSNSLLSDKEDKNRARHSVSLSYEELLHVINDNLTLDGCASVLLPYDGYLQWHELLAGSGWQEYQRLEVRHTAQVPPGRVVCVFGRDSGVAGKVNTLIIKDDARQYTQAFIDLLAPFYLNL